MAGSFNSSINTGLQNTPDLTDILSVGKLSFQFIQLYNAIQILQQAIDNYTGNTPASGTSSSSTPEQTILVGNTASMWCIAQTNLSAGFLVTLVNASGVTQAKYAQSNPTGTSIAYGLTLAAASAGQPVQILLLGLFNFGGSVTPGAKYYLSDTVPGGLSTTVPATTNVTQVVGFGVDANSIFFNPTLTVETASS